MAGTEQTDEAIKMVGAAALFLVKASKDGWDWGDLNRAMNDQALRTAVIEGVRGAEQIPGEITDADFGEIMHWVTLAINEFNFKESQ